MMVVQPLLLLSLCVCVSLLETHIYAYLLLLCKEISVYQLMQLNLFMLHLPSLLSCFVSEISSSISYHRSSHSHHYKDHI